MSRLTIFSFLFAIIFLGCSRKKDKFISRNFHALGTKYNILYNGGLALESGKNSLDDAFKDNFWDLLPVERMEVNDDFMMIGEQKNSDFERAEEKAIKAVQKHGMNIKGKEKNPQIDEAYLMLGKSRYFEQRFVPALEAFNYILYKYPTSDKINQARVWREKTNMRLDNDALAIRNLNTLLFQLEPEGQDLADISATLAQAYINLNVKDTALVHIKKAAEATKIKREQARYLFIAGQLYNEFGYKDSANIFFDKIIDLHRKIPRPFYINAHLSKIANFNPEQGNVFEFEDYLKSLEEDRENKPFLDKIYFRMADYYALRGRDSVAKAYYNKSLRTNTSDKQLKSFDYNALAEFAFENTEYKLAGAYYDSTLTNQEPRTKPYRKTKRKRENLEDVIYYEEVAKVNDSILFIVSLSEDDRLAYFQNYTDSLKVVAEEQEKAAKEAQELQERLAQTTTMGNNNLPNLSLDSKASFKPNKFYFYNETTVSYGKNQFQKIWGKRTLDDNWRWSSKQTIVEVNNVTSLDSSSTKALDEFDPKRYISSIPSSTQAIDSITKERNFAYYQLGVIYKEKFSELELAKDKLLDLLKSDPEERLILPANYNLYKVYEAMGKIGEAAIVKEKIISEFPDSRYAQILLHPELALTKDENSPEKLYEKLYLEFEKQNYELVLNQCDKYIYEFEGNAIVPKFEMLKASAKGKFYGFNSYKESMNFIALTYPDSPEGKNAATQIKELLPKIENKIFIDNADSQNFKVVYTFESSEVKKIPNFVKQLDAVAKDVAYYRLKISVDVYNKEYTFVVVHGLKSFDGADGFAELLEGRKLKLKRPFFAISSDNYQIVQIHKNLNEYKTLKQL
ncbi:MAG: tetratricopeptide repeat protein [Flavobacteriaceae bacterium]